MSEDLAVAIYAGRGWVPSPNTDWARFKQICHHTRGDASCRAGLFDGKSAGTRFRCAQWGARIGIAIYF